MRALFFSVLFLSIGILAPRAFANESKFKNLKNVTIVNGREIGVDADLGLVFVERKKPVPPATVGKFQRIVQCGGLGYPRRIWTGIGKDGKPLKGVFYAIKGGARRVQYGKEMVYDYHILYTEIPTLDSGHRYRSLSVTEIAKVQGFDEVRIVDGQLEIMQNKIWHAVQKPPFNQVDLKIKYRPSSMFSPIHLEVDPKVLSPLAATGVKAPAANANPASPIPETKGSASGAQ